MKHDTGPQSDAHDVQTESRVEERCDGRRIIEQHGRYQALCGAILNCIPRNQQSVANATSAAPVMRPITKPAGVSKGELSNRTATNDGDIVSAIPVAASTTAVIASKVFIGVYEMRAHKLSR